MNHLPKVQEKSSNKQFEKYSLGYFHVDFCQVRTQESKAYLFVGVDRISKFFYVELHKEATAHRASLFLRNLIFSVPYRMHTILTDNG